MSAPTPTPPRGSSATAAEPHDAPQPTEGRAPDSPRRLIPLADWPQIHPWPPLGGLRHLVFYRETNGFDRVVRKVGGRVLIDEAAFFAWVDERAGARAER